MHSCGRVTGQPRPQACLGIGRMRTGEAGPGGDRMQPSGGIVLGPQLGEQVRSRLAAPGILQLHHRQHVDRRADDRHLDATLFHRP